MASTARASRGIGSLLFCLLILAGCTGDGRVTSRPAPLRGGVFRLVYQNPVETFDPQRITFLPDWEIASFFYEGLVGYGDEPGSIRPVLAERWQELEGGRRWIFHLRRDVWFHDDPCFPGGRGRRVTAQDVVYTLERMASARTDSPNWHLLAGKIEGIDDYRAGRAAAIAGVEALDPQRIAFRLTRTYASFLKTLATQVAMIVPREAVEYYGAEFAHHPVGTGPFRLGQRKALEQYLLTPHPHYWRRDERGGALPYLGCVEISIRPDANEAVRLASLLKGDAHLFYAHERLLETLRSDPAQRGRFRVVAPIPSISLRFLGFAVDGASPVARSAELRRAVAEVFDLDELLRRAADVKPIPAHTLVPAALLLRTPVRRVRNPAAAREVLQRHRRHLDAAPLLLASNFQSEDVRLLQQSLAQASVRSDVQIHPTRYYDYIVKERPAVFRVSFTPSFIDPEDYYCLFYSRSADEVNLTGYRNPEYDRTLEAAMTETRPERRAELFLLLEEILQRDMPAIYLNHGTPMHLLAAPRVRGLALRFVIPDLTGAWLAEEGHADGAAQPAR